MKKYTLEVDLEGDLGIHEKLNDATIHDIRIIVSVLDESKLRFLTKIIQYQTEYNLKDHKIQ